jgi:trans-aconitate 2-methyltransferase
VSLARDWDARSYDRISGPLEALGREVLDRLALEGDETVLDAGCGSGRVTQELVARLPRGHVIGVDGSAAMIAAARERLGPRADLRVADLLELELEEPVDAVLSTATFHWVADHPRLFARLHAALRPGGTLAAQCGGIGNVAAVHAAADAVGGEAPFAEHLAGWRGPWNFSAPGQAAVRLEEAGFRDVHAWLDPRPIVPAEPLEFLSTIVLGPHLERLPAELAAPFTAAVAERLGDPLTIDYVRLNLDAVA